jgi:hypothetical protein
MNLSEHTKTHPLISGIMIVISDNRVVFFFFILVIQTANSTL